MKRYMLDNNIMHYDEIIGQVNKKTKLVVLDKLPPKDLIPRLNKRGYRVIFRLNKRVREEDLIDIIKTGKFYAQDDITTAVLAGTRTPKRILVSHMTFNQIVKKQKMHAEQILVDAKRSGEFIHITDFWYMDLEPCVDCLRAMAIRGEANEIIYRTKHKDKWNTEEYFEYVEFLAKDGTVKYTKEEEIL